MTELQNDLRIARRAPAFHFPSWSGALARPRAATLVLAALMAVVAGWLLCRNLGLNPAIFADEWYYSKMARLQPLADAIVPSYLYLWVYGASEACGRGFLDCVRVANVLFYVGAAPFIYLTARRYAGRASSIMVALLAAMAPANIYTAYFMPEAPYYFGFAVLSWMALTRDRWHWAVRALAGGAVLGLMSLVKVHALFILPSFCLYVAYVAWGAAPQGRRIAAALAAAVLAAGSTVALKFGLGYLLAGDAGLSLFGPFYSVTANSSVSQSPLRLLPPGFINARGHLMGIALLAALPLAILAHNLVSRAVREQAGKARTELHLYTLLMLGAGAGMTIAFTASIAGYGPHEVLRVHLRYYNFVFPLLTMIAAAGVGASVANLRTRFAWPIVVLVSAVLLIAVVKLPTYQINPVDSPELMAIPLDTWLGRLVVGIDILVLVLWGLRSKLAAPLFLFIALPLMAAAGTRLTTVYLSHLEQPGRPHDRAGRFAHDYVPAAERKYITVVTNDIQQLMRTQFHIDDKDTGMLDLAPGTPIQPYQIPVRHKWLLVIGNHPLPPDMGLKPEVVTPEYQLVRISSNYQPIGSSTMSEPFGTGIVERAEGLSHAEPWGRWSDSKQVVLHFKQPLPKYLNVVLKAQAYADNTTLPFVMQVGDQSSEFRLAGPPQEVRLPFVTDGTQRSLTITVPRPIAPSSIGPPGDNRTLGIGLIDVAIGTYQPDAPAK
ncbi:DUF7024 domain-containing protein [Pseudoduganella sp. GCM10020061]|uniref:ArnT family glycosyltransferase n=1 Tax=Pseudoduganella sp. GCM10020061 TaxID=3317345 RepID=UPI0036302B62